MGGMPPRWMHALVWLCVLALGCWMCLHGQCVAGDLSQCLAPVMCQPIMSHLPCQHLCLHCSLLVVSACSSISSLFFGVGGRDIDSCRASVFLLSFRPHIGVGYVQAHIGCRYIVPVLVSSLKGQPGCTSLTIMPPQPGAFCLLLVFQ